MTMETTARKSGQQTLSHLLAIAYHVLDEVKYTNLKPPLRSSLKSFAADVNAPGSPPSEAETAQDEAFADVNGQTVGFVGGQGHPVVVPFTQEEIQDTYTRMAALKTQYMKLSAELLEAVKELEKKKENGDTAVAALVAKRNQLRKEVYERNVVMKGLIDRLRNLQHSIRLMQGGSAYPPSIVMESV
ncbi:unnamed protein product [Hyaloperonospora brassicae]|uniref:Uncharacterized protein n=1 Tax=Hyaloperonospora brassicae TaxID=162125 RepID=A0AAV0TEL1_HYABA|nr:unnamed protein product [Hyaloperonospora brassicae]